MGASELLLFAGLFALIGGSAALALWLQRPAVDGAPAAAHVPPEAAEPTPPADHPAPSVAEAAPAFIRSRTAPLSKRPEDSLLGDFFAVAETASAILADARSRSGLGQAVTPALLLGVISHKGGTGKTTTSVNLAQLWAQAGQRVILVDIDPVASAATVLNCTQVPPGQVQATQVQGLQYVALKQSESLLESLQGLRAQADILLLDTPSLQHPVTRMVLPVVDHLLLTLTLDPLCLRTLEKGSQMLYQYLAPERQQLLGLLPTQVDARSPLQQQLLQTLNQAHPGMLLPAIPRDVRAREQLVDALIDPDAPHLQAYRQLFQGLQPRLQRKEHRVS